jgi:hypothetical protein
MNYATEMDSGATICIPSSVKTGSGIHKLLRRGYTNRHREQGHLINMFPFLFPK